MDNWRITQLKEMLEGSPTDEFILYALAKEYMNSENGDTALKYFLLLKEQNPRYVGMYFHLARLYIELENTEAAHRTYDEGIALATELGDLHALGELKNAKMNFELDL